VGSVGDDAGAGGVVFLRLAFGRSFGIRTV
jgi:hypothetical protein